MQIMMLFGKYLKIRHLLKMNPLTMVISINADVDGEVGVTANDERVPQEWDTNN